MKRDKFDRISFHEAQKVIEDYHTERVMKYKLMYPNLTKKTAEATAGGNDTLRKTGTAIIGGKTATKDGTSDGQSIAFTASSSLAEKSSMMKSHFVTTAVAPTTMFQKMKGYNNADLIDVVSIVYCSEGSCILCLFSFFFLFFL